MINTRFLDNWRRPEVLLLLMSVAMPLAFSTWMALINNWAVERAAFTGVEMGILQSVREIPGFLAFGVVFVLLLVREQTLALLMLILLGVGVAFTGAFTGLVGLCIVTLLMSIGFHFFETVRQSLALQWTSIAEAPLVLGRMIAAGSFASLAAYAMVYLSVEAGGLDMSWVYVIGGSATVAVAAMAWLLFPRFPARVEQRTTLVVRRRYWLYYALTFLSGVRRQIFVVFAGFLMVERFGFDVGAITLMFLANHVLTMILAPHIGRLVGRWGERRALTVEYIGLIVVFVAYAFNEHPWVAVGLYIVDHLFFAMALAMKTYFQKIADPADIASTAGVSFTINHIAAVVIPAAFGLMWIVSPAWVFLAGAAMAAGSLVLARLVPPVPTPDHVSVFAAPRTVPAE